VATWCQLISSSQKSIGQASEMVDHLKQTLAPTPAQAIARMKITRRKIAGDIF